MHGLKDPFKKLRNNEKLDDDKDSKDVAKNAEEGNKQHHTKTFRKHDTTCRFGFPRFPAPYTKIVKPCHKESIEEKEETLTKNRQTLKKVQGALEDVDAIKKIIKAR
jgi:hypothetical protein